MNLIVTLEYRFDRLPDGSVWTQTSFPYSFWNCYLQVFDSVRVVARVRDVSDMPVGWRRADGERVSFVAVPYYVGPEQFALRAMSVNRAVRSAVAPVDAVIMRVPSHLANVLTPLLKRTRRPYAVEVVGDPYDVFVPGAVRHPLRFFFQWWFTRQLKWQCLHACGVAYVTKYMLRRRYPPDEMAYSTNYSGAQLTDVAFTVPRSLGSAVFTTSYSDGNLTDGDYCIVHHALNKAMTDAVTLVTVASLAQPYKGIDVLIDAVAMCVRDGLNLKLVIVGDGKYRRELEARAVARNLSERVSFMGQLPAGVAVRTQLDAADLFVLPSRTEGLPRAMIEAMARGLPCIGSRVGGIPELLPPEDMVPPNDANALASKIKEVIGNPQRMVHMSERNFAKSHEYHEDTLRERRLAFYKHVRQVTEQWQKT